MGFPAPPELRDVVKLELLEQENARRIEEVWLDQYRFDERYISRILSKEDYETILNRLEECPMFIWPIHVDPQMQKRTQLNESGIEEAIEVTNESESKSTNNEKVENKEEKAKSEKNENFEEKYYVLLSQYQHKHIFCTTVDSFNKDQTNAPHYLTISIYNDLVWSKGVALLRAELVNPIFLPMEKARELVDEIVSKYLNDKQFENDVNTFNTDSQNFPLEQYLNSFDFVKRINQRHGTNFKSN